MILWRPGMLSEPIPDGFPSVIPISKLRIMKQMLMCPNMPHLPEEIILNILKRLPVRSLIRFQCVCKHWKNLIKSPSPSFITENLRHSTHQNPSLLLCKHNIQNRRYGPLQFSLIDCEMHVREVQNPPLLTCESEAWIVGSCNGLVCVGIIKDDISDFLLWNPVIGEVRQIRRKKNCKLSVLDPTGFGFSAIVNDYKIVRAYGDLIIGPVEAYSLSTGLWKEVEFGSLGGVRPIGDSVTANGCIFWVGLNLEVADHCYWIVSFDIAKEVFALLLGPPQLNNSRSDFTLSVHDNKLAIFSHSKIGHFPEYKYSLIDLWVLEEGIGLYTKRWSWTKVYTCPSAVHFARTILPRTIWRNDIVCCLYPNESGGERVNDKEIDWQFFVNIITNEGKMFAIPGGPYLNVTNHVDSLVPVGSIPFEEP